MYSNNSNNIPCKPLPKIKGIKNIGNSGTIPDPFGDDDNQCIPENNNSSNNNNNNAAKWKIGIRSPKVLEQQVKSKLMDDYLELSSSYNSSQTIVVENLNYSVMERQSIFKSKSKIEILNDLSFYLKPGMMVLLLSGPGCGKTSLFKCLSNRQPSRGIVEGTILFNGKPIQPDTHYQETVYVSQSDNHIPTLTVKETLDFSIQCQSQLDLHQREKLSATILEILGLTHCKDTFIGNHSIRGISGGQKKRMTVAVELVKGAKAIIMDEPSTGLDSTTSYDLVSSIKMISTSANVPVIISLLQPSPEIFSLFTHILMMRDGKLTFFGTREEVFPYFNSLGLSSTSNNPAEFLSNIYEIARNSNLGLETADEFISAYKSSGIYQKNMEIIQLEKSKNISPSLSSSFYNDIHMNTNNSENTNQQTINIDNNLDQNGQNSIEVNLLNMDYYYQMTLRLKSKSSQVINDLLEGIKRINQNTNVTKVEVKQSMSNSKTKNSNGDGKILFQLAMYLQIYLCVKRSFLMACRDRSGLLSRILKSLILGLLIGSLFFQLDNSQRSSQSLPSLAFFLLTFVVFGSLAGVQQLFLERPVYYDQRQSKYYSPCAYFVASLLSDLFWNFIDVLVFSVTSYWMVGLNPIATRFLFFLMVIYLLDTLVIRVSKTVSIFSPNSTIASTIAPLYFSLFLLMAGYLVPKDSIHPVLRVFHYISPFKWAYESILCNQVMGEDYVCEPDELLPPANHPLFNVPFPNGYQGSQVCQISHGSQILLQKNIDTEYDHRFDAFYVIVGMYVFYCALSLVGLYMITFDQVTGGGKTNQPKKPNSNTSDSSNKKSKIRLDLVSPSLIGYTSTAQEEEDMKKFKRRSTNGLVTVKQRLSGGCYLSFKDLTYIVTMKKPNGEWIKRTLLDQINGYVRPGQLLALMGASGSGKSTLLDILANRKDRGEISGEILLNAKPRDKCFSRYIAYVEQEDQLPHTQTVREAITFSALLRLPQDYSMETKLSVVDYIIDVLELYPIESVQIGKPGYGISMEQRKRVNIGVELASNPYILFLDEPTSGLDSVSAIKIMALIKKVSSNHRSVICTIHQPSETIFRQFDSILLLTPGGYMAYFGELGINCQTILNYCSKLGYHCPTNKNPADFLLDFSGSIDRVQRLLDHDEPIKSRFFNLQSLKSKLFTSKPTTSDIEMGHNKSVVCTKKKDVIDHFLESNIPQMCKDQINQGLPEGYSGKLYLQKNAASYWTQLRLLLVRFFVGSYRKRNIVLARVFRSLLLSLVTGTLYLQMENDQEGVMNRISFIFFTSTFASISCLSNIPAVFEDRFLFYREVDSSTYRHAAYGISMILSDLPFTFLYSILFSVPIYWIGGLQSDQSKFLYFIGIYYLYLQILVSFSQLLAFISPSLQVANEISGISFSIFSLFAGFIIRKRFIPSYFKWLNYISLTKYLVESLTTNEMLGDIEFHCKAEEYTYVPILNTTEVKTFCPIVNGDIVMQQFDLSPEMKTDNPKILGTILVVFFTLTMIVIRVFKYKK
ncbi:ABC transporter G family protein [Tieghemostelium lacteum]|uniref:ABC transporter G family protein n=1 Tax=Tieghemostelium lacteum TaxID=361077 RepID=A0A151ZCV8_TIELA|nr:ABC transporter G family protein [Tieghemostelium lacteum]|eukprot:KYQ91788.1 ABC transporter G family protein [Tieghemostelium lacteum]